MSIKVRQRDFMVPLNPDIQLLLDAISDFEFILPNATVFKMSEINKKVPIYLDLEKKRKETYKMTWRELNERIAKLKNEKKQLENKKSRNDEEGFRNELLPGLIRELEGIRDTYHEQVPDPSPDDLVPVSEETTLCGYYTRNGKSHNPEIVLLMKTLGNDSYYVNNVAITLIHEMFHAYYDHDLRKKDNYIPFVEEPLTEYAMLKFFEALTESDGKYRELFDVAKDTVQRKQYSLGLAHYGFGYYLWNHERKTGAAPMRIHWVEAFHEAKYKLSDSTSVFKKYAQSFHSGLYLPEDESRQWELLGYILLNANGAKLPLPTKGQPLGLQWKQVCPNAYRAIVKNTLYLDGNFLSFNSSYYDYYENLRHVFLESFRLPPHSITRIVLWDHFISDNFSFIKELACLFFKVVTIEVSPRNFYHTEIEGAVYDASKTILYYCPDLITEFWIPSQVKRIGVGAFANCNQLKYLYRTDVLEDVPNHAFGDCDSLEEKIIVNQKLFWVPNSETKFIVPNDVREIDGKAFKFCKKLQHLTISKGIEMIPNGTFEACESLKDAVVFNQKLLCAPKLTSSYTVPADVKAIDGTAFKHCYSLKRLTIPESVKIIPDGTFDDCISLEHDIIFKHKLMCAPKTAKSYEIPNGVNDIDSCAFDNCMWLEHVTIPGSLKEIPGHRFSYCKNLESVTIGEGIEKIGISAFEGCKLTDVTLPASLKEFDAWAFRECPLQTLTLLGTNPPKKTGAPVIEYGRDYSCYALVRVPKGSKAAYEKVFPDFDFDIEEYD